MTAPTMLPVDEILNALDFPSPCENIGCEHEAAWKTWWQGTPGHCMTNLQFCEWHMDRVEQILSNARNYFLCQTLEHRVILIRKERLSA